MALSGLSVPSREGWRSTVVGAALVYLGMRLVSAVVILLVQRHQPAYPWLSSTPYLGLTMHWDALWFRSIAVSGYPHHLPVQLRLLHHRLLLRDHLLHLRYLLLDHPHLHDRVLVHERAVRDRLLLHDLAHQQPAVAQNQWAFYPGFPFVTRAVMQLTGAGFAAAASVVNLVAGVAAATGIARVLQIRIPRAPTLAVVAVWAALPIAPTLQLAYSEALAMALLSLALLWLVQERWGLATVAALLLGLTRPILPPLVLVYGVAVWRRWRRRRIEPVTVAERWRMGVGLAVTCVSALAWPLLAWWYTGVRGAYLDTEAAWHHGGTGPFAGLHALTTTVEHGYPLWSRVVIILAVGTAAVLTLLAVRSPRLDPLLALWCAAYLVYDLAVGNMHADELRMLLPLFPLVAVACGVAAERLSPRWRQRAILLAVAGIAGQYVWLMLFVRIVPGASHPA